MKLAELAEILRKYGLEADVEGDPRGFIVLAPAKPLAAPDFRMLDAIERLPPIAPAGDEVRVEASPALKACPRCGRKSGDLRAGKHTAPRSSKKCWGLTGMHMRKRSRLPTPPTKPMKRRRAAMDASEARGGWLQSAGLRPAPQSPPAPVADAVATGDAPPHVGSAVPKPWCRCATCKRARAAAAEPEPVVEDRDGDDQEVA